MTDDMLKDIKEKLKTEYREKAAKEEAAAKERREKQEEREKRERERDERGLARFRALNHPEYPDYVKAIRDYFEEITLKINDALKDVRNEDNWPLARFKLDTKKLFKDMSDADREALRYNSRAESRFSFSFGGSTLDIVVLNGKYGVHGAPYTGIACEYLYQDYSSGYRFMRNDDGDYVNKPLKELLSDTLKYAPGASRLVAAFPEIPPLKIPGAGELKSYHTEPYRFDPTPEPDPYDGYTCD